MTREAELASIAIVSPLRGDGGVDATEVVAVGDLLGGLVEAFVDLLTVELGDNVEGGVCHGCTFRWNLANRCSDCARDHFNAILSRHRESGARQVTKAAKWI